MVTSSSNSPYSSSSGSCGASSEGGKDLHETMDSARQKLRDQREQLREKGDGWAEGLRSTVREHPVAAVAAALALGMTIARLSD